ncbi:hypothetical protein KDA_57130 [Dictyobacter alpinus]|uniref:Acyltransferase 3 domain-containing protein n=1 Tax=Dictyobacter alpinus TaxID=2014873 RepID=A0A402BFY9_9CHLR|nr:acyltransferase [Dictyobacter alpinus]GCE30229.1 hypothetical protein KDA_57130 [Dictyobacter alpinus]
MQTDTIKKQKADRIYYFDWLRTGAFIIVVLIHCIHMFSELYITRTGMPAFITNEGEAYALSFVAQWCMALYFLLAGASTWLTLRRKGPRQFIQDRVRRLLVPLVVGFVLLVPLQTYFEMVSNGQYTGTLLLFYPYFLESIFFAGKFSLMVTSIHHLWFLLYLFCISLLALPLCLYLRSEQGQRWIKRLVKLCCEQPAGIVVLALPIAVIQITLRASFPVYCSLTDIVCWLLVYMYGYILFADPRFRLIIQRQGKVALIIGSSGFMLILLVWKAGLLHNYDVQPDYSVGCLLFQVLFSLLLWSWLLVTLASADQYLNVGNSWLKYGSEASFSWYLLHFPVVVVVAYYILPLQLNVLASFALIGPGSLMLTFVLTDLLYVKLHGMRTLWQTWMQPTLTRRFSGQHLNFPAHQPQFGRVITGKLDG